MAEDPLVSSAPLDGPSVTTHDNSTTSPAEREQLGADFQSFFDELDSAGESEPAPPRAPSLPKSKAPRETDEPKPAREKPERESSDSKPSRSEIEPPKPEYKSPRDRAIPEVPEAEAKPERALRGTGLLQRGAVGA